MVIGGQRYPLVVPPRGPEEARRASIGQSRRNVGGRGIIGDASRRTDPDLDQTIITDLRDGAGTRKYKVAQGVTSYRRGDWDTRYDGALVFRTAVTDRGLLPAAIASPVIHHEYLGETEADWLAWKYDGTAAYHAPGSPGTWTVVNNTDPQTVDFITGFARYRGYYLLAGYGSGSLNKLQYSTNGTTWTKSGTTTVGRCLCVHDNKLFWVEDGDGRIQWSADDPTAGFTNIKSSDVIRYQRGESPIQLVRWEWLGPGGPAVVLLTTQRMLGLNEATGSVNMLFDFTQLVAATNRTSTFGIPWLAVWPRTGDGYITQYNTGGESVGDQVIHLPVGLNVNDRLSPNLGGGLPQDELVTMTHAEGAYQWLYVGSTGRAGTTSTGGLWAVNDRGGWHRLNRNTASNLTGIGYHGGKALVSYANRAAVEVQVPDTADSPQFAAGRSYETGLHQIELAKLDAGQDWAKLWTGVEIDCEKADGTRGMDAGPTVTVRYRLNGAATATTIASLTSADTFPARLALNGGQGLAAYEFALQLDGSGTNATKTPVITKIAINSLPKPPRRAVYDCQIDALDDPADATPYGTSNSRKRDLIEALDASGDLVAVSWGQHDDAVSLTAARVTVVARHTLGGGTRYAVQVVDFSPIASG